MGRHEVHMTALGDVLIPMFLLRYHMAVTMTDLRGESSVSAEAPGRLQALFSLAQNISGFCPTKKPKVEFSQNPTSN